MNALGRQLYLDCDGVLARIVTVVRPNAFVHHHRFGGFSARPVMDCGPMPDLYANVPLAEHARDLYEAVKHLQPVILTGCPESGPLAPSKQNWARRHFPGVKMICCSPPAKARYAKPGDVLVDDSIYFRSLWESAGGVFIHHTNLVATVEALKNDGILQS